MSRRLPHQRTTAGLERSRTLLGLLVTLVVLALVVYVAAQHLAPALDLLEQMEGQR